MNLQELHRLTIKLHLKELGRWQQHEIGFAKSALMRRVQWKLSLASWKRHEKSQYTVSGRIFVSSLSRCSNVGDERAECRES